MDVESLWNVYHKQNHGYKNIWGLFPKFMDSPCYSGSELCRGEVMVSLLKYLPWQAMHFLQCSTHFSKMCCRLLITSKFLASEPRNLIGQDLNRILFGLEKVVQWNPIRTSVIQFRSHPMQVLGVSNHEKWAPRQEILKWSTVCSTFLRSGWSVVRSALLAKGGTLEKRLLLHLHKVLTRNNKVSPQTLQTALTECDKQCVSMAIMIMKM
jgi:hypothetical protein